MAQVVPGRFTARTDEPFVVFMIGMRINKPLAVWKWLPTMRAMPPMLRELYRHPEKGFLGAEFFFHLRGPVTLQYWRSFEDLERFARNPEDPHLPAWQRFNKTVGSDGSVGIFHETFIVERGNYEAIYSNIPVFGLAKATEHVRAVGGRETARRRLMRGENEPAVPSPEQLRSGSDRLLLLRWLISSPSRLTPTATLQSSDLSPLPCVLAASSDLPT